MECVSSCAAVDNDATCHSHKDVLSSFSRRYCFVAVSAERDALDHSRKMSCAFALPQLSIRWLPPMNCRFLSCRIHRGYGCRSCQLSCVLLLAEAVAEMHFATATSCVSSFPQPLNEVRSPQSPNMSCVFLDARPSRSAR